MITPGPPIAWLSAFLNDGKRSGFKCGDKLQVSDQRGRVHDATVERRLGKAELLVVTCDGRRFHVKPKRPTCVADLRARLRTYRRDELGRFA